MARIFYGLILLVVFSCSADSSKIGVDFFKDGILDISYLDSASVKLSTVKYDSLITSGTKRFLLGSVVDEKLGRISALAYLQAGISQAVNLADANISFSYLAMVLKYDGYSYYDTSSLFTLNAHFLDESITFSSGGYLFNTSNFKINPEVIGTVSFKPRPHRADSVELRLPQSYGESFFTKAQNGHKDLQTNEAFIKYLKGFAIIPDTTSSTCIIGFNSTSELRLYYNDRNLVPAQVKYVSFPINASYFSTEIRVDRSNPYLKDLVSFRNKLSSTYTDDESYIQAGAGLALRVDMPYLRDLKQDPNFYVTQATLDIYPVRKSFDKLTPLPGQLFALRVDKKNARYTSTSITATLLVDTELGRDTRYQLDVTDFVKEQMGLIALNENALLFVMPDENFRMGADRIYFHSHNYEYQTKLRIYYASINGTKI